MPQGLPRLLRPERQQMRFTPIDLESLLPADHPARVIWAVVEKMDLSKFEATIAAREGHAGRPGIDPAILMTLWIYATSEGIGSAREVERLQAVHQAYQWICGGVHVNHHTLSDFRVDHKEALDDLFTQILGVLTHQGLVELQRVTQDEMKLRASAGAASFRREKSLKRCLQEARERAAKERLDRVERALAELPKVREAKKEKARVSTTDPEARVMKMGDGGFRPAYNAQFATDTQTRVIVGVEVTPVGNDMGQMPPMLQDVKERHGQLPAEYRVVDGGFAQKESIEQAAQAGGLPGGGGLAPADGDGAGQRDLQAESGHRGDDQRRPALQPCLGSISGARPSQSEVRDPVGRPDLQHPEADRGGVDQGLRAVGIEGNTRGRPGK